MELTTAFVVIGPLVLLTFLTPVIMRHPALKKRYEAMDDRRLVALQGQYRTGRRNMRIGAYLAPLPLLLLSLLSHERAFVSTILGFCFFASFSLLLAARLFGEIERVVTMELDFRKGNKDR